MNYQSISREIIPISQQVGEFIRQEARQFSRSRLEFKGSTNNLVSYVDKRAESMIVEGLQKILPEAGFITEEDTPNDTDRDYVWIVDPLDGTTNFVHGLPNYSVSIALAHKNELVAGVVYEINLDETFHGWEGGGAYLNDEKIHVSEASELEESLFATGFPYHDFEQIDDYLAILNSLMRSTHGLRRVGSAAVDLAYVACGRYEGFFEFNLNAYDLAAGALIVQEAGGMVTDFMGGNDFLFGGQIVAAGHVHSKFLEVIQQHWC